MVSRHMENGDAGCQIHGKETAKWFAMKDLKFIRHSCRGAESRDCFYNILVLIVS